MEKIIKRPALIFKNLQKAEIMNSSSSQRMNVGISEGTIKNC